MNMQTQPADGRTTRTNVLPYSTAVQRVPTTELERPEPKSKEAISSVPVAPKTAFVPLRASAVNPNRVKVIAVILSAIALLIACITFPSNYTYFEQSFSGWALYARLIGLAIVELAMIIFPIFLGWGNLKQGQLGVALSFVLAILSLTHTYFVTESSLNTIQAGKAKTEAQGDLETTQAAAAAASASNQLAQSTYQKAVAAWERLAARARKLRRAAPKAPEPPQLQAVPQVDQGLVTNATMSVAGAGEKTISHRWLIGLLFTMVLISLIGSERLAAMAHSSRARKALLRVNEQEFEDRLARLKPEEAPK